MTYDQIHTLFKQRYNQSNWKKFLSEAFANTRLLATPEILTGIDSNVASQVQKLGYITLNENGLERQIAVYEVTLAQGIVLERNRVGLRNLLRKYWKDIDAAFIAYHRPETPNWRFTYVSELTGYDADGNFVQLKTEPKRYTYVLGEGESTRTAAEGFTTIANKGSKATLDDVKEAFSVEKLSKAFFDEYKKHYDIFCTHMVSKPNIRQTIFNGDEKAIRDFVKKLLGRIVFLYFIQKKGWLGVPEKENWGKGDFNFLTNQFNHAKNPDLFYQEFLSPLFFETLNQKRDNDIALFLNHGNQNNPKNHDSDNYRIPYLNGGLFEEDDKKHRNLIFPANLFQNLFDFFNQYNFTIYEDDPNDHTVAVDPEMLGHIFENLLEDNKDKGAYYTPKEIVHYMCQESLIEYLVTYCQNIEWNDLGITLIESEQRQWIESLIKKKEAALIESSQSKKSYQSWFRHLNTALDNVKICDPAIGSGAFPMGLLHEIFTAKQTLHTFEHGNTKTFDASAVKLNIIQNSIYGVDIEKGAVDIARLRFWLSLIVDEEEPKALPNLDYKIVVGNSLVSKLGDDIIDIDWDLKGSVGKADEYVQKLKMGLLELSKKQKKYFETENKDHLKAEIRNLKIDILINQLSFNKEKYSNSNTITLDSGLGLKPSTIKKNLEIKLQLANYENSIKDLQKLKNKPELPLHFFDWKLDFPEVMNEQVTANVGFDIVIGNPPYGAKLNEIDIIYFKEKYKIKTSETAILFIEKGLELNNNSGLKTYIIPKSFTFASNYGAIRDYVENGISIIADCGKAFENVKLEACIISIFKNKKTLYYKSILFKEDKTFDFIGEINKNLKAKFGFYPNGIKNAELRLGEKMFERSVWLNEIATNNRGEILQKHITEKGKYPIIGGKEICKYGIRDIKGYINDKALISDKAKIGDNSILAQNIVAHITKPYEHLKIIACIPNKFNYLIVDTINQISISNLKFSKEFVWSILNSKLTNWYCYLFILGKAIRTIHFDNSITSRIPIPSISLRDQQPFINLANQILSQKSEGKDTTLLEQEIDNLVYKLYELTYDEVKVIDPEFSLTQKEYEAIKLE